MKERPILFSGEMVRAIHAGWKTQTRRVIKNADGENGSFWNHPGWHPFVEDGKITKWEFFSPGGNREISAGAPCPTCPYGKPGDRLWVKETHLPTAHGTFYRADIDPMEAAGIGGMYGGWKPSIFMPRKLSRITLEIKYIRAERLQDITRGACMAEGCPFTNMRTNDPQKWYADLWESINGKGSWQLNPWVWVVEFKQL